MRKVFLIPIDFYRKRLSKAKGAPCCRYFPSCSNYAYRAINEWGSVIGLILALLRIVRCNPIFRGGFEPVPRKRRKLIPKTEVLGRRIASTDKTAEMFAPEQQIALALSRSIAPVNPKTGNYAPYLTRMERYLDEEMKG